MDSSIKGLNVCVIGQKSSGKSSLCYGISNDYYYLKKDKPFYKYQSLFDQKVKWKDAMDEEYNLIDTQRFDESLDYTQLKTVMDELKLLSNEPIFIIVYDASKSYKPYILDQMLRIFVAIYGLDFFKRVLFVANKAAFNQNNYKIFKHNYDTHIEQGFLEHINEYVRDQYGFNTDQYPIDCVTIFLTDEVTQGDRVSIFQESDYCPLNYSKLEKIYQNLQKLIVKLNKRTKIDPLKYQLWKFKKVFDKNQKIKINVKQKKVLGITSGQTSAEQYKKDLTKTTQIDEKRNKFIDFLIIFIVFYILRQFP
ncbi:UNKNOWN [Stylonychia lemnae]|uniref:Uncharacterized protein n=1 Tax=Stylonychia lemnae TaxID=5949 RepID=A0A078A1D6_STYLE|nr:UNKNOWN [Stylonychia lemnae]|eukprot:CDW76066.1 UNKNOWN [Stylonychia lemnae]